MAFEKYRGLKKEKFHTSVPLGLVESVLYWSDTSGHCGNCSLGTIPVPNFNWIHSCRKV